MARNDTNGTSNRGFASMDPEKQKEIASKGGKAAHEKGTAHEFDSESAREAGRKGGKAGHSNTSNVGGDTYTQNDQQEERSDPSESTEGDFLDDTDY